MQSQSPPRLRVLLGTVIATAAVLLAWAVLQLWGLGKTSFHTKGEPREAVVVAEIVRTGEWVLARRNAVELPAKPPLFHWLGAIVSRLAGGVSELTVRLPSALQSLLCALLLLYAGTRLFGTTCGTVAALALLSSFEWLRAATSARVDMTLACGLTVSFLALLLQRTAPRAAWVLLAYAGAAWATLSKGPVGIALPALLVLVLCVLDRSARFARDLFPLRGLLAVALVAGAWYALAALEGGTEFVQKQILDENVYRFLGHARATGGHRHSAAYLALMLALGLLPWTLFVPSLAATLWRQRATLTAGDPRAVALVWIAVVFGFYALPASKRGVYLLPLYPAVCLLLGWWAPLLLRGVRRSRFLPSILFLVGSAVALLAAVVAILVAAELAGVAVGEMLVDLGGERAGDDLTLAAAVIDAHAALLSILLASIAVAFAAHAGGARWRRWGLALPALFAATTGIVVATRQVVLPAISRAQTRKHFALAVEARVDDPAAVHAYRDFDYGLVYYWGAPMPVYDQALTADAPRLLVLSESEWHRLPPSRRRLYERVAGLESGREGNLGRLVLVHRVVATPTHSFPAEPRPDR